MIKKLRFFLTFLLVASAFVIGALAATTTAYVKKGASGTGLSSSSPIGSISDAFGLFGADGGTIYIIGEYPITTGTTISEKKFDYTLKAGSGGCISLSANLALAQNTNDNTVTFDLPFKLVGSDTRILFGGFNNVVFGKNFSVEASSGGLLNFYGGMRSGTVEAITELPYSIVVNAGKFNVFAGGNFRDSISAYVGSIAAPVSITINGGSFGKSGTYPKDTNIKDYDTFNVSGMSILADDATLTINGGTFYHPIYVQGRLGTVSGEASAKSKIVKKNKKYYAIDGDIEVNITGGTFKGGAVGAHFTQTSYTTVMRGDYTVNVTGGTFASGTTFDATQVKAYSGSTKKATITYPTSKSITPVRFDYVNGTKKTYTDPIRVVFIGDSITEGYAASGAGVDRLTESYPAKFLKYAEAAGREVIIGNYGVSASGLHPATKRFYENMLSWPMVSEESAPDYVFIAIGINDAKTIGGTNGAFTTYKSNLQKVIKTMGNLPDTDKVFIANALYCVMDIAVTHRAGAALRPTQEIIARDFIATDSSKYRFVDLYGLTLSKALDGSLFRADNGTIYERLHPATAGLDFIGNTVYKAVFGGVLEPSSAYQSNVVYVSDSGSAHGAGTASSPISDLGYAYTKLDLNKDCTIYVSGTISLGINFHTPVSKKLVTFAGYGNGATIKVYGNTLKVGSNIKFTNLTLKAAGDNLNVIGAYHNVEMTSTLKTSGVCNFYAGFHPHSNVAASSNTIHDSVESASSSRNCTIKINGGTWHSFALGNARYTSDAPTGTYSGTMNATIGTGATVGDSTSTRVGIVGLNYLTGTINVTIHNWGIDTINEFASTSSVVYKTAKNTGSVNIKLGSGLSKKIVYGPVTPTLSYDGSAVTVKWDKKATADRYRIFRKKSSETAWDGVNRYTKELSYVDKTAVAGTTYDYAVQAQVLVDGEYSYSEPYIVQFTPKKLSVPTVTAKNTVDGVSVTATSVSGAEGYIFYRSTDGKTLTQIAKTTSATYVDKNAKANTKYYYYARAYSGAIQGGTSAEAVTIRLAAINPSIYYKAEVSGVHLMWSAVANAERYRVFRRVAGESAWDDVSRYVSTTQYIDDTVKVGTTYEYAVQVWVPLGDAYVYGPLTVKTVKPETVKAPTVTAKNTVDGVIITATAVSGAEGYIYFRSTNGTTFTQIGKSTETTYTDKTATANTKYYYCARAYKGTSQSENSTAATTIRLAAINPSIYYKAEVSGVHLMWSAVANAERYRVFRRVAGESAWDDVSRYVSETQYIDDTVKVGTTYEYAVQAWVPFGDAYVYGPLAVKQITPATVSAPTVTAKNTVDGVIITATAVSGAEGYIYFRSTNGTTFTQIGKSTETTYTDNTAKANTTYYYCARAYKGTNQSENSTAATTIRLAPINPSIYYKAEVSGVHLMWSAVANAERYRVFRRVAGESAWDDVSRYVSETQYIDDTVKVGTTYEYAVQAWVPLADAYVYGPLTVKQITPATVSAPTVTAKNTVDGVIITATAVSGAEGYIYYRSTNGTTFTQIGKSTETTYTDKTAIANTTYYYCARAYKGTNQSENSVAATTIRLIPLEAAVYYSGVDNGVHLEWNAVKNADRYRIFRKEAGESAWDDVSRYVSETEYVDTTATVGTTYDYSVQVWVPLGEGYVYSPLVVETITPALHSVPSLTGKITSAGIVLTSTAVATADGYIFYRSTDGETFEELATTSVNTYTDTDVSLQNKYYYKVCAYFGGEGTAATSDFSNVVSVIRYAYVEVNSGTEYDKIDARVNGTDFTVLEMQYECGTTASFKEIPEGAYVYAVYGDFIIQNVVLDEANCVATLPYANADALVFANAPIVYYGDANSDGEISLPDIIKTLKYSAGGATELDICAANISGDIEITVADVLMTLSKMLNTK